MSDKYAADLTRYAVAINPEEAQRAIIGDQEYGEDDQARAEWAWTRARLFKKHNLKPYRVKIHVEVELIDESEVE